MPSGTWGSMATALTLPTGNEALRSAKRSAASASEIRSLDQALSGSKQTRAVGNLFISVSSAIDLRPDQPCRNRLSTYCCDWFACASMAVPAWARICALASSADSFA